MFPNAKFLRTEVELERIKILRQLPDLQYNAKFIKILNYNAKLWDLKIALQFLLKIGKMESSQFMISFYHRLYSIKVNSTNCSK